MIELERTFLVRRLPEIQGSGTEVLDHYFPGTEIHPVLRLRKIGSRFFLTKKKPLSGADASAQAEETIVLSEEEHSALSKIPAKKLRKIRHVFPLGRNTCELDIYQDGLEGLVMADFEFRAEKEKAEFRPPGFCLAEVTQEKFLAGGMLAGKIFKDIEPLLNRFGYRKLFP